MSRHGGGSHGGGGKRVSVFDRLGPGNDEEITSPHASSSSRHSRHYPSSEKHERSSSHLTLPTEERVRDKRVSDPPPRKHRHVDEEETTPIEGRPAKREKLTPTVRKDIKPPKPSSRGSGREHEISEEQTHAKRKRERDSLSDTEGHHRETKRQKISDASADRHHQLHKTEKKESESQSRSKEAVSSKKRSTVSETQSESDQEINWGLLSKFPRYKTSAIKMTALERHKSGPVLASIGVSSTLAGQLLAEQAKKVVQQHLKRQYGESLQPELLQYPFGGHQVAGLGASHLRRSLKSSRSFDVGYCRRALTARADFILRKKCLGKYSHKSDDFRTPLSHFYSASLRLYQKN